jgi:tRNA threonylcarbamoyladenosine biosynthesis protein TsaB
MAILLSLETSTGVCSAAVHENGKLLASTELNIERSASSQLAVIIHDLLRLLGVQSGGINGVAVSEGPGSYTGLRIGVATAKGLCFALNVPLISVNTLRLMAYQITATWFAEEACDESVPRKIFLCPMLDARRMEVYCLIADVELNVLESTASRIIDERSFDTWFARGRILFFGNGSEKCKEIIRHPNATFVDGIIPSAARLGELAFRKFEDRAFEDLSSFEPLYLKDFVAKKPKG